MLEPGGRVAGYLIHTPVGLSESETARARDLGPSAVASSAPGDELTSTAGLTIVAHEDVTGAFHHICESILKVRAKLETELRAEEGDEVYEEEVGRLTSTLTGIREGLLLRSLVVAVN